MTDLKQKQRRGHLALCGSNTMWGIMAPISKALLAGGAITATALADMRLLAGTILFWILSLFVKTEKVDRKDALRLFRYGQC